MLPAVNIYNLLMLKGMISYVCSPGRKHMTEKKVKAYTIHSYRITQTCRPRKDNSGIRLLVNLLVKMGIEMFESKSIKVQCVRLLLIVFFSQSNDVYLCYTHIAPLSKWVLKFLKANPMRSSG